MHIDLDEDIRFRVLKVIFANQSKVKNSIADSKGRSHEGIGVSLPAGFSRESSPMIVLVSYLCHYSFFVFTLEFKSAES